MNFDLLDRIEMVIAIQPQPQKLTIINIGNVLSGSKAKEQML